MTNVINGIDIREHTGLASAAARRYRWAVGASLDFDDLVQAGLLGLVRAAKKFDPERGFTFGTYAANWCRAFVAREVLNHGRTVRVPVGQPPKRMSPEERRALAAQFFERRGSEPGVL